MVPPLWRLCNEYNPVSMPNACSMQHEAKGFCQCEYCGRLQTSIVYQGEEGLVGCQGGGNLPQLPVIGQLPWDGGDGQKRCVANELKGFGPSDDDYDARGEK